MMGYTIPAPSTHKRGQAEDSRAFSKGTDCCPATCTQRTGLSDTARVTVLFTQVTWMWKNMVFSHPHFL